MGTASSMLEGRPCVRALAAIGCSSDSSSSSDGGGGGPGSDTDAKVGDAAVRDASMVGPVRDASTDTENEPSMDAGV